MKLHTQVTILLLLLTNSIYSQSTYQEVRNILNTKCSVTCHGNNTYSFNLSDPDSTLYDSLINATPVNAFAQANNFALISPGYPDRSFLLRKVANCISADLALHTDEGAAMPENEAPLDNKDIELIRQWILFGAPETGMVIDTATINAYYQNPNRTKVERPAPPKSCEGFQIHMGPIFYQPGEESEYYQRYDLNLTDTMEVIGTHTVFNNESHHFIITKYINNTAQYWPQGLVKETDTTMFGGDKEFLVACMNGDSYILPNGTAFYWDQTESLDLNFHLFNTQNEVLAAEVYVNVYTQPKGNALKELESSLSHNYGILIPNDGQSKTIQYHVPVGNISISNITSHTHKHGTNFDVYLRNSDGSKGLMIFNGSYNYRQGFETGQYDWAHPPVVYFEPFLDLSQAINNGTVPAGLLMEATYLNSGADTLAFGITTADEMMAIFFQFVDTTYNIPALAPWTPQCLETYVDPCLKDTTIGIVENGNINNIQLGVYPNPSNGSVNISYQLEKNATNIHLEVVNLLGEVVSTLVVNEPQVAGKHSYQYNSYGAAAGLYIIRLQIDGVYYNQKLIKSAQ